MTYPFGEPDISYLFPLGIDIGDEAMNVNMLTGYTIKLVRAAISGDSTPIPPEGLSWNSLYIFAYKHKLVSLIYFAIIKLPKEIQDTIPCFEQFRAAWKQELFYDANRQTEANRLSIALTDNKIDYVFLKGYVSKLLYPDTAMRSMGDMDVLYRFSTVSSNAKLPTDEALIKIMNNLGYNQINHTPKDDTFFNQLNSTCIELHRTLVDKGYDKEYDYLENIWNKLEKKSEHEYVMRPEDFYIYHIIHLAKHVRHSGIGLLQFVDLWLFINHHKDLDLEYLHYEFSTLQLDNFELYARMLACKWFGCGNMDCSDSVKESTDTSGLILSPDKYTQEDNNILDLFSSYIFRSGSYGTEMQMEINTIAASSKNGKTGALVKRLFPDKTTMVNYYGEIIEKHSWLIPFIGFI